jgi:hypothetical protein
MTMRESPSKEAIARIERLVHETESLQDPAARSLTLELVRAVMHFDAMVLGRIVELLSAEGAQGSLERLLNDDLVSSALALHDAHPEEVSARLGRVMDKLRRYFDSRGAQIEVLELDVDRVRVRYIGKHGNPESRRIIEDAISEAAPEISSIVVEGIAVEGIEAEPAGAFVPLSVLTGSHV